MRSSLKIASAGVLVGAVGWGVWELAKWGVAIVSAPETLGASLIAAAVLP
jgi:hypothetical protein